MIYYISTTGSDGNDGTMDKPFKTLKYASTRAKAGDLIKIGAGMFYEPPIALTGVRLQGAGKGATILRGTDLFSSAGSGYQLSKFLVTLGSGSVVSDLTIDGSDNLEVVKKLYGGILVKDAANVTIDTVDVRNTFYTGIWLWTVKRSSLRNVTLVDCAWGSTAYCSGALNVGDLDQCVIDVKINEGFGYGIKAIGPNGANPISNTKFTGRISVNPFGLWQAGKSPNIALELQAVKLFNCEISDMYVDGVISLVKEPSVTSTGAKTVHMDNVVFDMVTRAKGESYPLELTIDDVEVEHCKFIRGRYGIANWAIQCKNWSIHDNMFYGLKGQYPGECVRSEKNGLSSVQFYRNSVFLDAGMTMNIIGVHGGASDNIVIKDNLLVLSPAAQPGAVVRLDNGATMTGLVQEGNVVVGFNGSNTNDLKI